MVGKLILPLLGGTPAVWSTCLVFFQAALLAGYAYAHASTAWLGTRRQPLLHLAVLAMPLFVLPLGIDRGFLRGSDAHPVIDVLAVLALSVGLPFVVVSATAPLLQAWFADTRRPAARDPYFLYAASNLGSMLALLSYPVVVEPRLPVSGVGWVTQSRLWTLGYVLLAVLTGVCGLLARLDGPGQASTARDSDGSDAAAAGLPLAPDVPTWGRRLHWVALTFVPSSLLLGATTYITTDLAAVPLLWVLPLALYLLTFILAFGRWPAWAHRAVSAAVLPIVLVVLFLMLSDARPRIWVTVLWHLLALFVAALGVHGELARGRPPAHRLTEFYLLISIGGALGGIFNALVAPLVFRSLLEYPLALALACVLVRPGVAAATIRRGWDLAIPLGVGVLAFLLFSESLAVRVSLNALSRALPWPSVSAWLDPIHSLLNSLVQYGPPLFVIWLAARRPRLRRGLSLAALLLVAAHVDTRSTELVHQARSFFGVLRLTRDRDEGGYVQLRHGTTLHGQQSLVPAKRRDPAAYYHRRGPVGQLFAELDRRPGGRRVAVIGLGTGTLAAYGRTGDAFTFYEIDRLVVNVATDPAYFTYLEDARDRAVLFRIELGDARVRLEAVKTERPGERYDVIVVDAFSSDAIPVHLLTREALRLYLDMLNPGGVVAFHISNRYLDLEPVLGNLAEDADLGGRLLQHDDSPDEKGASASTWVLLANTRRALGALVADERWTATPLPASVRVGVWTDDFHNLLAVFRWK
jgi:spermidine synthase